MKYDHLVFFALGAVVAVSPAAAEIQDRPAGVKIGQRLTLRPYVSFDFTYDSNSNQQNDNDGNTSWHINPHLNLTYKSERFNAELGLFYGYRAYNSNSRNENGQDYGEDLRMSWTTAAADEKGWTILLTERYQRMTEDDDFQNNNGRGLWRDRTTFLVDADIERRFTDKLHASVYGSYYYLDYANDSKSYIPLYGWQRWMGGVQVGYALSKWTDFVLTGNYQGYSQDNDYDVSHMSDVYGTKGRYSSESRGYTVHAGLQSRATEKISYRVLAGWSRFEYAGGESDSDGFTYSASANWMITDTWHTMLLASSYYQPSEREYGSANRVDSVSWGLAHSMIRGKLNATLDAAYRRETRAYTDQSAPDYDEDIFSFRLGLDYTLNRFFAIYARGEYQCCLFDEDIYGDDCDYNRFRVTVGFRLQY